MKYFIVTVILSLSSFAVGYYMNPCHKFMKNDMVTIILPDGTGHAGSRNDTIFIDNYCKKSMYDALDIVDKISIEMNDDSLTIIYYGDYFKVDKTVPRDSALERYVSKRNKEIKKRK